MTDPIVVVEGDPEGHRLYYLRVLAEADQPRPLVWLTTRAAAQSRQAEVHLGSLRPGRLDGRILDDLRPAVALPQLASQDVVIPDGDKWLPAVVRQRAAHRPRSLRLLLMRPPAAIRVDRDYRARWLKAAGKAALTGIAGRRRTGTVHVWQLGDPFGYTDSGRARPPVVPDPVLPRTVPSRQWARVQLGLPSSGPVVGLLGLVDRRKNPGLVAAAVAQQSAHLLVAGELTREAAQALERSGLPSDRLTVCEGYLSVYDFAAAAAASDVLAALYDNHHSSSGILALAAQAGTGVLVPAGGMLERVVSAGRFGVVAPALSTVTAATALADALGRSSELGEAAHATSGRLGARQFQSALLGAAS
jgi:hypothetical protein